MSSESNISAAISTLKNMNIEGWEKISVDSLEFSVRTLQYLKKNELRTFEDIINIFEKGIIRQTAANKKIYNELAYKIIASEKVEVLERYRNEIDKEKMAYENFVQVLSTYSAVRTVARENHIVRFPKKGIFAKFYSLKYVEKRSENTIAEKWYNWYRNFFNSQEYKNLDFILQNNYAIFDYKTLNKVIIEDLKKNCEDEKGYGNFRNEINRYFGIE